MASKDGKITLSAAVPIELKERVQRIAKLRRWTLSQTIVILLEEYLDALEEKLGIEEEGAVPVNRTKKD